MKQVESKNRMIKHIQNKQRNEKKINIKIGIKRVKEMKQAK